MFTHSPQQNIMPIYIYILTFVPTSVMIHFDSKMEFFENIPMIK